MIVVRILAVFVVTYLLSGCYFWGDMKSLKRDIISLKALIRAHPSPTECLPPGTPQARICNYSLVVEHLEGDYYMGYVNSEVVKAGYEACKTIEPELREYYTDFECRKADDYKYVWYGFKVEGDKPTLHVAQDFINIPETGKLKLGTTVKQIRNPIGKPILPEFKEPLKPLRD